MPANDPRRAITITLSLIAPVAILIALSGLLVRASRPIPADMPTSWALWVLLAGGIATALAAAILNARPRRADDSSSPSKPRGTRRAAMVLGAVGLTAIVVLASVMFTSTPSYASAVVDHVIDGDTVDVIIDGRTERVRLLNVDAPENNRSTGETECLGPEATDALEDLLPAGAVVELSYDVEKRDPYGRLLAAIHLSDGTLVNAQLTAQGLAGPVSYGDNTRFYDEVAAGMEQAIENERGVFGSDVECTVGAQLASEQAAAEPALSVAPSQETGEAALAEAITATAAAVTAVESVDATVDAFAWVRAEGQAALHEAVRSARTAVVSHRDALTSAHDAVVEARQKREAEEAAARAAAEEAARKAAEEEAARRAAEEAARKAAEEAARRPAPAPDPAPAPAPAPAPEQSSDSPPPGWFVGNNGYTGCRQYAPGGKYWKPIDC